MTKRALTREQKMFKQLAATGKFVSTGKVLIGVAHVPRPQEMTWEGEQIQGLLLGHKRGRMPSFVLTYTALLVLLAVYALVACHAS